MEAKTHLEFIFIDESGDLGKFGSRYFTIVSVAVHELTELSRIMKRLRQRKFKKKLKELPEIKANNSNESVRKFVLERIASADCSISAVVIPKEKISEGLFGDKDALYNRLCGMLFEHISLNADIVDIVIDKKHSNRIMREDFDQYIRGRVNEKAPKIDIRIRHLESHSSNELQAVDFIAWAVNRKFTHGDSLYYDIIAAKMRNCGNEIVGI